MQQALHWALLVFHVTVEGQQQLLLGHCWQPTRFSTQGQKLRPEPVLGVRHVGHPAHGGRGLEPAVFKPLRSLLCESVDRHEPVGPVPCEQMGFHHAPHRPLCSTERGFERPLSKAVDRNVYRSDDPKPVHQQQRAGPNPVLQGQGADLGGEPSEHRTARGLSCRQSVFHPRAKQLGVRGTLLLCPWVNVGVVPGCAGSVVVRVLHGWVSLRSFVRHPRPPLVTHWLVPALPPCSHPQRKLRYPRATPSTPRQSGNCWVCPMTH